MSVLVDTPVWSLVLPRRDGSKPEIRTALEELILTSQAKIIGPIRQEVLSGIAHAEQYEKLRQRLRAFPHLPLETRHFETAAEMFDLCRKVGVQGSSTDFLLCSVAQEEGLQIFTTYGDFEHYAKVLGLSLYRL
ncbi:MAG: PIN domain nuclease [Meiothermus sp.]